MDAWDLDLPRGVGDGCRFGCHRDTTPTCGKWCAGGDGIQQRELLRWYRAGSPADNFGALAGPWALLQVAAAILGRFVQTGMEDGRVWVAADGLGLEVDGDMLVVTLDGEALGLGDLAPLAHPAVLDPDLQTEQAPPLGEAERDELRQLGVGTGWHDGPGRGLTVAVGA